MIHIAFILLLARNSRLWLLTTITQVRKTGVFNKKVSNRHKGKYQCRLGYLYWRRDLGIHATSVPISTYDTIEQSIDQVRSISVIYCSKLQISDDVVGKFDK